MYFNILKTHENTDNDNRKIVRNLINILIDLGQELIQSIRAVELSFYLRKNILTKFQFNVFILNVRDFLKFKRVK